MRKGKKKILFVGHDASLSGAPLYLLRAMRWLREHTDLSMDVLLLGGGPLADEYLQVANQVNILPNNPLSPWFLKTCRRLLPEATYHNLIHALQIRAVKPFLNRQDVDLICFNSIGSTWISEALSQSTIPTVCIVHELSHTFSLCSGEHTRDILEKSRKIVTVSNAASQNILSLYQHAIPDLKDKLEMIYGFIPTSEFKAFDKSLSREEVCKRHSIPSDAFLIGGTGRQWWGKGVDLFLQLAKQVKSRLPDSEVHFVWVGDKSTQNLNSQLAYDLKKSCLESFVHFIGTTRDVATYYAAFDLFAMTSREDTFPLACLEVGCQSVPIVCFEGSGGVPELLDFDRGLSVPYLDVSEMANKVIQLKENKSLREAVGSSIRQKVEESHDIDVVMPKIYNIINQFDK